MAKNTTRLELTWIGKENRPKLEPRVLIEDPSKSHHAHHQVCENDIFDNFLIHGDNLLALKALEQNFAGKVKCVFIDPPYNTGSAFAHYDDGLEHSIWLSMMRDRLELIRNLLSEEGSLWITLDDNEAHYMKVICDEIFGRRNFVSNVVWQKKFSPQNDAKWISNSHDHLLCFAKDKERWFPNSLPRTFEMDSRYKNPDNDLRGPWASTDLTRAEHRDRDYWALTTPSGKQVFPAKGRSWSRPEENIEKLRAEDRLWFGPNGDRMPRLKKFLSEIGDRGVTPQSIWMYDEVGSNQEAKREVIKLAPDSIFDTPKPERLAQRVLCLATQPGDLVLDSFLGSGTTAAVAHKMGRRWIGIELGDHCMTHCIPRLKKVVDGEDPGGITKAVKWMGGGGFRYYRLAPTLIVEDEWSNSIINPEFNARLLAEAMCKLEGYMFAPNHEIYWQHGQSSEADFIYVTTQFMSKNMLMKISDEVGPNQSLLICCSAFRCNVAQFENLTVKKIPKTVLKKCEWGHDDYSLEVQNLPSAPPELLEQEEAEAAIRRKSTRKFGKGKDQGPTLFDLGEGDPKEGE